MSLRNSIKSFPSLSFRILVRFASFILTLVVLVLIMELLSLRALPVIYHFCFDALPSLFSQTMNLKSEWSVVVCKRFTSYLNRRQDFVSSVVVSLAESGMQYSGRDQSIEKT